MNQTALSWVWLVDLERTVALLVGRCLGGMLQGAPTSLEEQDTAYWMKTPIFSNGLEMDIPRLGEEISPIFRDILEFSLKWGCIWFLYIVCVLREVESDIISSDVQYIWASEVL